MYEYLLDYHTIVVQRLHQWREFYVIDRLKRLGKRIVYDIDDDIFNIPSHNPASHLIRNDECEAARAIMNLADAVTTTTEILKGKLGFPEKTFVIPNAVDLDDGYPAGFSGSADDHKRILWWGSPTHQEDWKECFEAVDQILQEMPKVRVFIMGMLPDMVKKAVENPNNPHWDERVEFMDFKDVETYIGLTKSTKADVGICPLQTTDFNSAKSAIKWIEMTAAGVPVIASDCSPYKEATQHGINGFLAKDKDAWIVSLRLLLNDPEMCKTLVQNARATINEKFDAKKTIESWEKVIFP
jgi:glycosyltransferase involved in cell wall biosynthesis